VLTFLNAAQLVLYIALLALLGQGVLYVLAGAKRDSNVFYKLLQVLSKPFTAAMRKITPSQVADRHVPLATFVMLLVLYFVTSQQIGQAGCR
jgi:cytochrome b561